MYLRHLKDCIFRPRLMSGAVLAGLGTATWFSTEADAPPTPVYAPGTEAVIGYTGTPRQPYSRWHVHDPERPRPETVRPRTGVFTPPPPDAVVLFDGSGLSAWTHVKEYATKWVIDEGLLRVAPYVDDASASDIETRRAFGDIQMHIEWRIPAEVDGIAQSRGNSGVFLMGRYEIQILDSFENPTYADGQAAAIYGWMPPLINASLPPGQWQSYDIVFEAPRFGEVELVSPAFITLFHNGVLVHHRQALPGEPTHQRIKPYEMHGAAAPIRLQNHRSPVEFRNIWVREVESINGG